MASLAWLDPHHGLSLDGGFQMTVGRNGKLTDDNPCRTR
jgi:hypothetical protein